MSDIIMKIYLMLIFKIIDSLPDRPCNRLKIGQNWYEKKTVLTNIGRPYNLNIHKSTNTLFFSYTTPETYSDVDFQLAAYNMDSRECNTIVGLRGGFTVAIDQANDEIYLGGSEGIYKYNVMTRLADFYKEKGVDIWGLFYRRNLFYIRYPDQKLHILVDGKFVIVKEFANIEIDFFYITNNNVLYFANRTGMYKYENKVDIIEVINELISVRQITEDNNGVMYVCTNLGIYMNVKNGGFQKILDIRNIYGLDFDSSNNFILSGEKSIIRLEKSG